MTLHPARSLSHADTDRHELDAITVFAVGFYHAGMQFRAVLAPIGPELQQHRLFPGEIGQRNRISLQVLDLGQLGDLVAQTSAVNGTLTYTAETVKSVVFATAFLNTAYRVHVSVEDFIAWRIINPTTTGFDIELASTYTGDVGFDVFV